MRGGSSGSRANPGFHQFKPEQDTNRATPESAPAPDLCHSSYQRGALVSWAVDMNLQQNPREVQARAKIWTHLQVQLQCHLSPLIGTHVVRLGGKVDVGAGHATELPALLDSLPAAPHGHTTWAWSSGLGRGVCGGWAWGMKRGARGYEARGCEARGCEARGVRHGGVRHGGVRHV